MVKNSLKKKKNSCQPATLLHCSRLTCQAGYPPPLHLAHLSSWLPSSTQQVRLLSRLPVSSPRSPMAALWMSEPTYTAVYWYTQRLTRTSTKLYTVQYSSVTCRANSLQIGLEDGVSLLPPPPPPGIPLRQNTSHSLTRINSWLSPQSSSCLAPDQQALDL